MPIELIPGGAAGAIAKVGRVAAAGAAPGAGAFADSLQKMLGQVEKTAGDANVAVGNMLDKTGDVHDAMIALHHAETSLQLTVQIRNKLVSAYHDIMRMPI